MAQKIRFSPLSDRVVLTRIDEEDKTPGGIIIPDTAKEKSSRGRVVAVGPGKRKEDGTAIPMVVSEGDEVVYGKWTGSEVKIDGQELLIVREDDIMGIIR